MNKALKLILSIPLIVLCCWIIFHATKIALADISHYPLKYFIEKLKPTELPDLKILEKLQEKIQYSIDLRPNSAEYLEYIGRIYYLKALRQQRAASFEIRSKAQNSFRLALNAHIKATKLRPKWPYSWANLALIKSHLKEFDQQFLNAIDLAIKNGPWEIASNNAISQAGFNSWQELDASYKTKVVSALERVYQQRKSTAIGILNYYQRQGEVCSLIEDEDFLREKSCEL